MRVYIMPMAVSTRLKEQLDEARRLIKIDVHDAKLFHFDVLYTKEEQKAFGINNNASLIITTNDPKSFEDIVPERKDGVLNFLRLNNDRAVEKIRKRQSEINKMDR